MLDFSPRTSKSKFNFDLEIHLFQGIDCTQKVKGLICRIVLRLKSDEACNSCDVQCVFPLIANIV